MKEEKEGVGKEVNVFRGELEEENRLKLKRKFREEWE